ncbi:hypothetical protein [Dysosmobacter sp.]
MFRGSGAAAAVRVDGDNDGVEERYEKHLPEPGTFSTVRVGQLEFQEGESVRLEEFLQETQTEELRFYTLWADRLRGRTGCFLYFWRPDGYTVYGRCLTKDEKRT